MACLVLTALIWGFAFVSQVQGMASMSPLFFNATRFTLGAISLIPLLLWKRLRRCRESGKTVGAGNREADDDEHDMIAGSALSNPLIVGMICGVFLFAASTLQQYGIMFGRSAGRAGFITALYIVMVPLLAYLVLRRAVRMMTWTAVGVAVVGFYLLCITDGFGSLTLADCLLLFTAVLFAAHILSIDTLGARVDALTLSFIQFVTTAALSWAGTLIEGSMDWERGRAGMDHRAVCGNRVSRRRLHVAGCRPTVGAADPRIAHHVAGIGVLGHRRRIAVGRDDDGTRIPRLCADLRGYRARADARCRPQTIGGEKDRKTGPVNAIGECDRKTRKTESR